MSVPHMKFRPPSYTAGKQTQTNFYIIVKIEHYRLTKDINCWNICFSFNKKNWKFKYWCMLLILLMSVPHAWNVHIANKLKHICQDFLVRNNNWVMSEISSYLNGEKLTGVNCTQQIIYWCPSLTWGTDSDHTQPPFFQLCQNRFGKIPHLLLLSLLIYRQQQQLLWVNLTL